MIRPLDLHWPTVAGSLLVVLTAAACVPANADSLDHETSASSATSTATTTAVAMPSTSRPTDAGAPTTASASTAPPTRATTSPATSPAVPTPVRTIRPGTAVTTLATLSVKGRAAKTGYDRDRFGQAWADVDRNGCDTRNDVLRRDLTHLTLKAGTHGCLVLKGTLQDPYTGTRVSFVRGQGTSTAVQVDHVVAMSDAWQKGAQPLSQSRRTAFANDPLNLLAVDGPTNLRKGDGDAATWLPPRKAGRCAYVARQIAVKKRYGLWVTPAERDAMVRVLTVCPGQPLPKAGVVPLGGGREQSGPAATSATPGATPGTAAGATPKPGTSGAADPRFDTCREANAAGFGPYRRGADPEYDWYQDRDHDGLACER
jgi:hypothetical protein